MGTGLRRHRCIHCCPTQLPADSRSRGWRWLACPRQPCVQATAKEPPSALVRVAAPARSALERLSTSGTWRSLGTDLPEEGAFRAIQCETRTSLAACMVPGMTSRPLEAMAGGLQRESQAAACMAQPPRVDMTPQAETSGPRPGLSLGAGAPRCTRSAPISRSLLALLRCPTHRLLEASQQIAGTKAAAMLTMRWDRIPTLARTKKPATSTRAHSRTLWERDMAQLDLVRHR